MEITKIKYLILLGCFCISTAWADINNGAFSELTLSVAGIPSLSGHLRTGGGIGYKYNSSNENYFGYFQGSFNFSIIALGGALSSDEVGNKYGSFDFEYGYELRRERSFSYGISISPIVPMFSFSNQLHTQLLSFIGVFGNIKINNSFLISIETKGLILALDYFVQKNILDNEEIDYALHPLVPLPLIEVKGKYFF